MANLEKMLAKAQEWLDPDEVVVASVLGLYVTEKGRSTSTLESGLLGLTRSDRHPR